MASKDKSPKVQANKRAKGDNGSKTVPWKAEDKNSACPYLVIPSAKAMIEFLEKIFDDIKTVLLVENEERVRHAEVKINNDSILMMGDSMPGWDPCKAHVHVYVPDVDKTYEKALKAGAKGLQEPIKHQDPNRRCAILDPSGYITFWISTQIEPREPAKEDTVVPWKPDSQVSVASYLVVQKSTEMTAFLEKVFDAKEVFKFEMKDVVVHAEVEINKDSIVMMCDVQPGWITEPVPCHVHVYVPDVDATFQKALEAGGKEVQKPEKKDDADKRGGFKDPSDTVTFWVATQVEVPAST